jgi:hypothetical protein
VKLTAEHLRSILSYDPDTGVFVWTNCSKPWFNGCEAGTVSDGYVHIQIDGTIYRAHRLAWLYTQGEWPDDEVDHRDLNRSNNRLKNLRPATTSQNKHNQGLRKSNSSGHKGVSFYKRSGKWQAQIMVNRKRVHIGYFATIGEAAAAYDTSAYKYHNEFARTVA